MGTMPAFHPAQIESPLDQYSKVLSIKGQQQQLDTGKVQLTQAQNQLKDQQAMTSAMQQWDGSSYDSLIPLVVKNGGSATAVMGLKQHAIEQRKTYSQIAKDDAETGKNQIETRLKTNDLVSGHLNAVMQVPDDQLPQALMQTASGLAQQGLIDPQHAQQAAQLAQSGMPAPQLRSQLDLFRKGYMADSQLMSEAKDKADIALKTSQTAGSDLKNTQAQMESYAPLLSQAKDQADYDQLRGKLPFAIAKSFPDQFDKDAVLQAGMTASQVATARNPTEASLAAAAAKGNPEAETALKRLDQSRMASRPVVNVNNTLPNTPGDEQKSGDAYLATLSPSLANQVRAITDGRTALPSGSTRSQAAQQVRAAVFQYDPTYNDQRAQIRKAFATGPDGRGIGALNTAVVHIDRLGEAAKGLDNGSFQPGNKLSNYLSTMFGASAPTTFEGVKNAVAGEMASALKGQATDIEIANISRTIGQMSSPKQLSDWIDANIHILGEKLSTYKERYQAQNPDDTRYSPVLPSALKVYQKHGMFNSQPQNNGTAQPQAGVSVTAPNGKTYSFPNQSAADAFKKRAGI